MSAKGFVVRRIAAMILVLIGVSILTFSMLVVAPGDPAELILEQQLRQEPTQEQIDQFREEHGMNDPFPVRYARWAGGVIRGDLGESFYSDEPVGRLIVEQIPETTELAVATMVVALLISLPAGILSAVHKGQFPDFFSQFAALLGLSVPNFWFGYLLIMLFALHLKLFPVTGVGGLEHLVLPALTVGTAMTAILTRLLRSSMLEVLDEEYIRTARSKGLPERIVVYKHALKNAFIPILTIVGLQFGALLNGTVIAEVIFQRPGLGSLMLSALGSRDYPVVMGVTLLIAGIFVVTNFVVDIMYGYIDPRISIEGRAQ